MKQNYYANGIDYVFDTEADGWISIYEFRDGLPLRPLIQAKDIEHAESYCIMRECPNVILSRLV